MTEPARAFPEVEGMTAPSNPPKSSSGSVDLLFAGSTGDGALVPVPANSPNGFSVTVIPNGSAGSVDVPGAAPPAPPPDSSVDPRIVYDWVKAERQRLEEYT